MRDIVVTAIVAVFLPMALSKPHIGILLWSWIGYMNPHRLGWGFAYNLPFALAIAAVTLVGILFTKEPKKLNWSPVLVVLIFFNLWFIITNFFAFFPDEAWVMWQKVIKIQFMTVITLMLMLGRKKIEALIWVITASIGFFGVKGGLFTIMTGGSDRVLGPPGTFIEGNTEIALALVMIFPLMVYLQTNSENKWIKRGFVVAMVLMALAIVGSYSRGAFLAGGCMGLFLWWKSKNKMVIGAMMIALIPLLLMFMPAEWTSRMNTIETYDEDASALGRINAWYFAFNVANDRPLVGGGMGAFDKTLFQIYAPEPDDFHDAHSIYFEMLGEQGYVGLILFLTIGVMSWRNGAYIIDKSKKYPELAWAGKLAAMVQVSLIGYATGGAFLGLAYFDLFYHLVVILLLIKLEVDRVITEDNSNGITVERGKLDL